MSLDEIEREIESYNRCKKAQLKERATMDYTLANLIGVSVSRIYSESATYPQIHEVYPELFKDEMQTIEQQKARLSIERFKAFAIKNNQKYS